MAGDGHALALRTYTDAYVWPLTGSDVVGRLVARPQEIDVGIITALIGAPFFIAIVRRQKVRDL